MIKIDEDLMGPLYMGVLEPNESGVEIYSFRPATLSETAEDISKIMKARALAELRVEMNQQILDALRFRSIQFEAIDLKNGGVSPGW